MINKIVSVTNSQIPFIYYSWGCAVENLGKIYNVSTHIYNLKDFKTHNINNDDSELLFIIEVGHLRSYGYTGQDLRELFPNCKLIGIASDTPYFKNRGIEFEFNHPNDFDLLIDTTSSCATYFKDKGFNSEYLWWTASDTFIDIVQKNTKLGREKSIGVFGLFHPGNLNNVGSYRYEMINYIRRHTSFSHADGRGHEDKDLGKVFSAVEQSWINLESSSSNDPISSLTGKGWRNTLGAGNSLLVVDNFEDWNIVDPTHEIFPRYTYGNFNEIIDYVEYYKKEANWGEYQRKVNVQLRVIKNWSIEKQLIYILNKYNILRCCL